MSNDIHKLFQEAIVNQSRISKRSWANMEMDIAQFQSLSTSFMNEIRGEYYDQNLMDHWKKSLVVLLERIIDVRETLA